jgi:hypothetical protein
MGNRSRYLEYLQGGSACQILVRGPGGAAVPMTAEGEKRFADVTSLGYRALKVRERLDLAVPLAGLFQMNIPGEYTLLASMPVIGDVDAVLTAAPIRVRGEGIPSRTKNKTN